MVESYNTTLLTHAHIYNYIYIYIIYIYIWAALQKNVAARRYTTPTCKLCYRYIVKIA